MFAIPDMDFDVTKCDLSSNLTSQKETMVQHIEKEMTTLAQHIS